MTEVFLKLLNMSIAAGWIVLAAVLLRAVMRRSPKWVRCLIWAVVALRLVLPFSIQSPLSIIPSAETVVVKPVESAAAERLDNQMAEQPGGQGEEQVDNQVTQPGGQTIQPDSQLTPEAREITINTGIPAINALFGDSGKTVEKPDISSDTGNADAASGTPGNQDISAEKPSVKSWLSDNLDTISRIWLGGVALMLCYAAYSYIRLRLQVRASVACDSTVYICDDISSPFILGVFRPRIYLPSNLDPDAQAHVLAHERTHISRRDHLWKPLGYALLAIYWFNPLLWLAYVLFCRDIELACDEKAVSSLDEDGRADYSKALVVCSFQRRAIAACPLAFGEVGVRARVRKILSYHKPAVWITACALVLCIALAACTLTDRGDSAKPDNGTPINTANNATDNTASDSNGADNNASGNGSPASGKDTVTKIISSSEQPDSIREKTYYPLMSEGDVQFFLKGTMSGELYALTADGRHRLLTDALNTGMLRLDDLKDYGIEVYYTRAGSKEKSLYTESLETTYSLETLKTKHPQYFGLDTSEGLTVYYSKVTGYGILTGKDGTLSNEAILLRNSQEYLTAADVCTILEYYGIPDDSVSLKMFFDPLGGETRRAENRYTEQTKESDYYWLGAAFGGRFAVEGDLLPDEMHAYTPASITELRKKYPEYFNLNVFYGIQICVSRNSEGELRYMFMNYPEHSYEKFDLSARPALTADEIQTIVQWYWDLPSAKYGSSDEVSVCFYQDPFASYKAEEVSQIRLYIWEQFNGAYSVYKDIVDAQSKYISGSAI